MKTTLTSEEMELALVLAARGMSIRKMGCQLGIEPVNILKIFKDCGRLEEFNDSRNLGLEVAADDLLDAHEMEDLQRAVLFSRNAQWILTRRMSHIYGDKVTLDHKHQIDLGQAMRDASLRLHDATPQIPTMRHLSDAQSRVIEATYTDAAPDHLSDSLDLTPEALALLK